MIEPTKLERSGMSFETGNYLVTHYHSDPRKLIIVFMSAGRQTPGSAPIEEFRNSLRGLGTSTLFVADKHILWFNYSESADVFARISAIADQYEQVGSMGESMGGSGALLATKYVRRISRVLAMSPQYSVASPFIRFDFRYEGIGRYIPHHYHSGFALASLPAETVLVYGNTEWPDQIHAMAFAAHRLPVTFIEGASHNVAAFLKAAPGDNKLIRLVALFADFSTPFLARHVETLLSEEISAHALQLGVNFIDVHTHKRHLLESIDARISSETNRRRSPKISAGKTASQSSVCLWSRFPYSTALDANGAINGDITGQYSFHTDLEESPWWAVDLHQVYRVDEVRIFNYLSSVAVRTAKFVIEASVDGDVWAILHERSDEEAFGGANGHPFVWRARSSVAARHIRIRLTRATYLHLDQVEVFGTPAHEKRSGIKWLAHVLTGTRGGA